MHQTVGPNHLSTGIAQDRELLVHHLLPDEKRVLAVVDAYGYDARLERIELRPMPRELAQLSSTEGSPVPAVEDQEHAFAALRRKVKALAVLVLQREVRRRLARGGSKLWLWQDL
jgi:hypothetical protein